jgi:hypothetical protein
LPRPPALSDDPRALVREPAAQIFRRLSKGPGSDHWVVALAYLLFPRPTPMRNGRPASRCGRYDASLLPW